jgi:hypothetical protein
MIVERVLYRRLVGPSRTTVAAGDGKLKVTVVSWLL